MSRLAKIARSATLGVGIHLRIEPYGESGIRHFLRDVLALANAAVEGPRFIIIGAEIDAKGAKTLKSVTRDDFTGKPSYRGLVNDFIEPPIRLIYESVSVDGKRLGVFEIGDCQDRPYMMRADYSERLRRGDAYVRVDEATIKMGRRQLQEMFETKFRESVSGDRVEIGFPGEIIHKDLKVQTVDLSQLPSALASQKLRELLDIRESVKNSGSTTVMARLTHARLFGTDRPYEDRSAEELMHEMAQIEEKHRMDDEHFLFETNAKKLQLVVFNQGEDTIQDASLSLVMPNHNAFHVASQLPKVRRHDAYVDRGSAEMADYPTVNLKDDAIHVSNTLGDIPPFSPIDAFESPLRICVGSDLRGRKLGIRYSLFGRNLRNPSKGKLRLLF
jgi:hypothetical protein